MISGDSNNIQIMGAANDVQIMGFGADALPPGTVCPPGASYCEGPSHLSPADLARVQAENAAANAQSKRSNTMLDIALAVGAVLLIGGGVAYATHKG